MLKQIVISAMPTYLFINNNSLLEKIEEVMSKEKMVSYIEKHNKLKKHYYYFINNYCFQNYSLKLTYF